jgi:hypothetical protein
MSADSRGRLRFADFKIERLPSGQCRSRVALSWPGSKPYVGEATGLASQAGELRCAAQACLNAIGQAIPDPLLELVGVKAVRAFDATVVIASLAPAGRIEGPRMVGSCLIQEDSPRGAALAVLNASNRVLTAKQPK